MKFYTSLNQLLLFLICSTFYSCKSDESIEKDTFIKNKMMEWDQLKHQVALLVDELDKLSRVI